MDAQGFNQLPAERLGSDRLRPLVQKGIAVAKALAHPATFLIAFFDAIGEARQRAYERRLLGEMDPRLSRDIGLAPRDPSVARPDPAIHDLWRGGTGFL